jgi:hypothetical protein
LSEGLFMKVETLTWTVRTGWSPSVAPLTSAQLIIVFGDHDAFSDPGCLGQLRQRYPGAEVIGCSTGGQVVDDDVSDDIATATVLQFAQTQVATIGVPIPDKQRSEAVGLEIGHALRAMDLRAVLVLSDGININGSRLVSGLRTALGDGVVITGGLAGDGARFEQTTVHLNGTSSTHQVVAVGLYGESIRVGHGNGGGWSAFGPRRQISRSRDNVLFELDGKPALDLYKFYLGCEADGLPGTGLLYPLLIADPANPHHAMVRTLLAVDEQQASMMFAGDMPEGWTAQMMQGHFDRLSEAAATAAMKARAPWAAAGSASSDKVAILISCIGRRILMGESIVEEIAAVREAFGRGISCTGFYAYGEISPHETLGFSELHNQTMTITTLSEVA